MNAAVNELLTVPTTVNYVGKAANLYKSGYELNGSSYVINKLLERLGTAAQGWVVHMVDFLTLTPTLNVHVFIIQRSELIEDFDNYDGTVEFLRNLHVDDDELTKFIIGTIGEIDAYQLPDAKGYTSLMRHLLKITPEERQERREQILGTTNKSFNDFAGALEAVRAPSAKVSVCSNKLLKS